MRHGNAPTGTRRIAEYRVIKAARRSCAGSFVIDERGSAAGTQST
jgi:hypothetical protein